MYYVNKIVGGLASPLGLFFLAFVVAGLLQVRGARRMGHALAVAALVGLWILSCGVTTRLVGLPLEGEEIDERALPTADAIMLLGGGVGSHEACGRAELYSAADRVWMAARLWRAGKAPKVFVSGVGCDRASATFMADLGVATNALVYLSEARNTEEESRALRAALGADGRVPSLLLVTSAWHMPRARTMFERRGFRVIPAPTDYEVNMGAECPLSFTDFLPNAEALFKNSYLLKEWVARLGYAIIRR